jgi:excisionase family DNA binding protein
MLSTTGSGRLTWFFGQRKEIDSTMATPTRLITVKELSDYLRVHPSTIYRLLKRGELPAIKLGSDWRFSLEAIDRWRQRQSGEREETQPEGRN